MAARIDQGVILNIVKDHATYDISYDVAISTDMHDELYPSPFSTAWVSGSVTVYNYDLLDRSNVAALPYSPPAGEFIGYYSTGRLEEATDDRGYTGLYLHYSDQADTIVSPDSRIVPGSFGVVYAGNGSMTRGAGEQDMFVLSNYSVVYIRYMTADPMTGERSYVYTSINTYWTTGEFAVLGDTPVAGVALGTGEIIKEIKTRR